MTFLRFAALCCLVMSQALASPAQTAVLEQASQLELKGDFKNAALEGERALTLPELGTFDAQIHFLLAKLYTKLKQPDLANAHRFPTTRRGRAQAQDRAGTEVNLSTLQSAANKRLAANRVDACLTITHFTWA